jgi:hypothetical protein
VRKYPAYIPAVSHTIHVENGRATGWAKALDEPINVPTCGVSRKKGVASEGDPRGFQYSSGNKKVVALRSASVMIQNFVPLLIL